MERNNELVAMKKNKKKTINCLKRSSDDTLTSNSSEISNIINKFFAEVGPNLASGIPVTDESVTNYLGQPVNNTFSFFPVIANDILDEINLLPNNKASGLYSCPVKLLKLGGKLISEPLSLIFNKSIETGIYPNKLKIAKIIPIHKSDDETNPENYRPISLLSIFNRLFEKIMYNRLIKFIDKYDLLYDSQYGFRAKHSTQQAIIDITHKIQQNMDHGKYTCGIFIDLKKAFDTVNHDILLKKLHHYGIRGIILDWFKSYLSNRKQTVSINGSISNYELISCGVPQGSVLGPLLFLIYINDIFNSSKVFSFHLFADDTSMLCEHKSLNELQDIVNIELSKLSKWLNTNRLSLNVKKTNFVIFRPRQKKLPFIPSIYLSDNSNRLQQINNKDSIQYLGVLIDSRLSWKQHIDQVAQKISRSIGIIAKLRHYVPRETMFNIYKTLVNPYINYGICSWGNTGKTHLKRLLVLQKRALRLINFSNSREHAIPFFLQTRSLPLNFLYFENMCIMMHDIFNNRAPKNLNSLFKKSNNVHRYGTRSISNQCFYIDSIRTESSRRSFIFTGTKIWNCLPVSLKTLNKFKFKRNIRTLLLQALENANDYINLDQIMNYMRS